MGESTTLKVLTTTYPKFTSATFGASENPEQIYTIQAGAYIASWQNGSFDELVDVDDLHHIQKSRDAFLRGDVVDPNEVFAYLAS